ncbi:PD-(D/E)XK nuclease family protein [Rugamonas aquatica]|uniref:PD-(D/E)XK endonuclease-like domain-containing protein n=1 Tax=Rugamonas aquatica TaxID=2743357 RepID=A0A6A7N6Y9_9BURK|nr:hypothetical protein [Rugamonas aquatica]MQA40577.1 hypothetical protein [Rugamonas aquatica]
MMASAILVLIAAVLVLLQYRGRRSADPGAGMPRELRNATIAYSEKLFETMTPFHLVARVDRVYRIGNMHYLLELKTRVRHSIYPNDIIELSAQRLAITASTDLQVSGTGYVATQVDGERRFHRVNLLSGDQLVALYQRRRAILDGTIEPACNDGYALCAKCSYRAECEPGARAVRHRLHQASGRPGHSRSQG